MSRRVRRELAACCAIGAAALSACTSDLPEGTGTPTAAPSTAAVYEGRLPGLCDELLSPLSVARALNVSSTGQRSYSYQPPDEATQRLRGLTCEFGVSGRGPAVTVVGEEYAELRAARGRYRRLVEGQPGTAQRLRFQDRPAAVTTASDSTLVVLDEERVLEVTMRAGAAPAGAITQTMSDLMVEILDGLK